MMRNSKSIFTCLIIGIIFITFRFSGEAYKKDAPLSVTCWDALGYYIYLPSILLYDDYKELKWFDAIDKKYNVSGGAVYQASKHKSGNYVFKYLGGVAILEAPLFLIAHYLAPKLGYAADGFSPPYQHAIALGAILYFILSLLLLRKILLRYFNDTVTALTLLAMMLASNLIQYISVDGAMSHAYIFPLYVLILYFTIKWHEKPSALWATLIGVSIGLAMISRPTEIIMFFIPLLWDTHNKEASFAKWQLVKAHKLHLFFMAMGGFLAILPQLLYWKSATGSFIYDVGSKWHFANPHFRVLFGWEIGWFIYTPIAVFFMLGMFFMKEFPFRKSVITFCLLNIYIIIAWHDWRYGATYSCRALTQSYPIFALALAAFIHEICVNKRGKYAFYILGIYLIGVNLFQVNQYNKTILHYRDMNRAYYSSIYLNPNPSPLNMSLLDNNDVLYNENKYTQSTIIQSDTISTIDITGNSKKILFETQLGLDTTKGTGEAWLKIEATIYFNLKDTWDCHLNTGLENLEATKYNKVRLVNPIVKKQGDNDYTFFVKIPENLRQSHFVLFLSTGSSLKATLKKYKVKYLK
jgi:hypothetical protein